MRIAEAPGVPAGFSHRAPGARHASAQRLAARGTPFGLPVIADTAAHWVGRGARFLYTSLDLLLKPSLAALREASAT